MSIIQSIIGTSIYTTEGGGGGGWVYPPIGNGYPSAFGGLTTSTAGAVGGYYEASSLLNTPAVGLYRRTYVGAAFSTDFIMDPTFPDAYTLVEYEADPYVGFAAGMDVNENFTMEWIGYFKPTQSGDFAFGINVDDYVQMWIGAPAVSGYDNTNTILQGDNSSSASVGYTLTADKYYPVRIRYVENSGGHNCSISSGLIDGPLVNNQESALTGQFFFDTYAATGAFPPTGLVV